MTSQTHEPWLPEWTFGDRIRKVRRAQGLTQAQFAKVLGVGDRAASAWETFDRTPREVVAIAKRIELAFGVPATWMLGLEMQTAPRPDGPEGGDGLPRLDSNQQPSGYPSTQVSEVLAFPDRRRPAAADLPDERAS